MTDPQLLKECGACFAEFTGSGDLCPDCQSGYDQTHDENGNLIDYDFDQYGPKEGDE